MPWVPMQSEAVGRIDGATGTLLSGKGFSSVRIGAGTYDITLDVELDNSEMFMGIQAVSAAASLAAMVDVTASSDSVKRVLVRNSAAVLTDPDSLFIDVRRVLLL